LKRECEKLELPVITCHGIRHTAATHLLKKGADLREVQEFLGHKRIRNTEKYTRLTHEDLKKVVDTYHPREKELS
jgi:integrase/recombinase XerD